MKGKKTNLRIGGESLRSARYQVLAHQIAKRRHGSRLTSQAIDIA
jgi:hypothetical protein